MALIDVLNFTNKIGEMNIFIVCFAILVVIYIGSTHQLRTDVWNIAFLSLAVCILAHEIGNYIICFYFIVKNAYSLSFFNEKRQ